MRVPKRQIFFSLLAFWCSVSLFSQESSWKLVSGPRILEVIPLPVLWVSQVWEAVYEGSPGKIQVYGLGRSPFLLEGGRPLDCPGVRGQQRNLDGRAYVHLPEGFLLAFPEGYPGICPFLTAFRSAWERFQGVSYYRGGITLPPEIPISLP